MKKIFKLSILILIPVLVLLDVVLFNDGQYIFISITVAVLACVLFFASFEKKNTSTRKLIVIAVMTALSVAGRFLFAVLPGFKPITAIVVITALFFGSEAGFLCGALSAFISNMYFGQGPWTPFQMLAWGLIGFLAGLFSKKLKASKILLSFYGIFTGVFYSLVMDVWSVLWVDNGFNISLYLAKFITSMPSTVIYAVSNVIFLLLLVKPVSEKLDRIKTKYMFV